MAHLRSHPLFSCYNTDGTESSVKTEKSVLSCFFAWPLTPSVVASMQEKVAGEGRGMGSTAWAGRTDLSICLV